MQSPLRSIRTGFGRIRTRLLIVNLTVLFIPVAGLEFAELYERQLLGALERDMRNQALVTRRFLEADLRRGIQLSAAEHDDVLRRSAEGTRTRIRVLDRAREVVVDSHRSGPPEGPEAPLPSLLGSSSVGSPRRYEAAVPWPSVAHRREVTEAFAGSPSSYTRVREREPAVFLFITEPIMPRRRVEGVVYVVRSTRPVIEELYRIRTGILAVLGAAAVFTALVTLALAWSISRPLSRLSRAAKRIAAGERDVPVPVAGHGEIRELAESFAAMTTELNSRLRYISDFAADVAHEFKSPLTAIRGAAELLQEGAAEDPAARDRFLRNILLDTERLDRVVSRLLELSRIEASALQTARELIALEPLVRGVARRSSHPITVEWRSSVVLLPARETDLETALGNLLDNAIRFSPENEAVVVSVDDAPRGRVRIAVTDRGPGVSPANVDRIFDRFFTTEPDKQGTGLGLAIVKAVADAHGGEVRLESPVEGGARLVLTLPSGSSR